MHFKNYITIIIIINYSSALNLRNNRTGKIYLFFVHSDADSNPTDKNIFLSLEVCKINMYVNVFGNAVQTPGSTKRFPPLEHIRCILIVHHHHHHLHHSQWHLNCFPVQQKINKADIWADGVCVCQWGRLGWHIFQSEGVGNTEAAVMEAINLSPQALLTSPIKKENTRKIQWIHTWAFTVKAMSVWWVTLHFLLSTTSVLIND